MFNTRTEMLTHWTNYAVDNLAGRRIVAARLLRQEESENLFYGESGGCIVLQLDDGTLLVPFADDEGNRPGALFGIKPDGSELLFPTVEALTADDVAAVDKARGKRKGR